MDFLQFWIWVVCKNAAEPVNEQRKFGFENDAEHNNIDGNNHSNFNVKSNEAGNGGQRNQQRQQQQNKSENKSPLSTITGGADPECAVVLYLRFEEKNAFEEETKEYVQRDSGPYETNGFIFGSE